MGTSEEVEAFAEDKTELLWLVGVGVAVTLTEERACRGVVWVAAVDARLEELGRAEDEGALLVEVEAREILLALEDEPGLPLRPSALARLLECEVETEALDRTACDGLESPATLSMASSSILSSVSTSPAD